MRRLPIVLSIALVFALFVVAAATAAPSADKICDKNPDHSTCAQSTSTTTTATTTTQPFQLEACETTKTITGNGRGGYECLWTPEKVGDGAKVATVTLSNIEGIKQGSVFVRDDSPGDICVLEQGWGSKDGSTFVAEFKLFYDTVPDGYDAWLGASYWDLEYVSEYVPGPPVIGAYWCSPQDPVLETLRFDNNGAPLHLRVGFNAGNGGSLDIELSPRQAPLVP
jgi:hypothetical protein